MSKGKLQRFLSDNVFLIVCVPMIIGIHWGWLKIQNNPTLVDPEKKKELPLFAVMRRLREKIVGSEESPK